MNEHDANRPDEAALWRQWRDQHAGPGADSAPFAGECPSMLDLAAFIDHRCDAATTARIEAHLAACVLCRASVAEVLAIQQSMIDSPAFVRSQAMERARQLVETSAPGVVVVHRRLTVSRAIRVGTGWGIAAAAALAIGVGGYQLGLAAGPSVQLSDDAVATAMSFGLLDDSTDSDGAIILLAASNGGAQQ